MAGERAPLEAEILSLARGQQSPGESPFEQMLDFLERNLLGARGLEREKAIEHLKGLEGQWSFGEMYEAVEEARAGAAVFWKLSEKTVQKMGKDAMAERRLRHERRKVLLEKLARAEGVIAEVAKLDARLGGAGERAGAEPEGGAVEPGQAREGAAAGEGAKGKKRRKRGRKPKPKSKAEQSEAKAKEEERILQRIRKKVKALEKMEVRLVAEERKAAKFREGKQRERARRAKREQREREKRERERLREEERRVKREKKERERLLREKERERREREKLESKGRAKYLAKQNASMKDFFGQSKQRLKRVNTGGRAADSRWESLGAKRGFGEVDARAKAGVEAVFSAGAPRFCRERLFERFREGRGRSSRSKPGGEARASEAAGGGDSGNAPGDARGTAGIPRRSVPTEANPRTPAGKGRAPNTPLKPLGPRVLFTRFEDYLGKSVQRSGRFSKRSALVSGRRPCARDEALLNYELDTEDELQELEAESCRSGDSHEEDLPIEDDYSQSEFIVADGSQEPRSRAPSAGTRGAPRLVDLRGRANAEVAGKGWLSLQNGRLVRSRRRGCAVAFCEARSRILDSLEGIRLHSSDRRLGIAFLRRRETEKKRLEEERERRKKERRREAERQKQRPSMSDEQKLAWVAQAFGKHSKRALAEDAQRIAGRFRVGDLQEFKGNWAQRYFGDQRRFAELFGDEGPKMYFECLVNGQNEKVLAALRKRRARAEKRGPKQGGKGNAKRPLGECAFNFIEVQLWGNRSP